MSMYTLPFLYLNVGGEMLYILEQRLKAQKISDQKQKKIMQDILGRMLSDQVLSTLFVAQPLTTLKRLKANFTKLANASLISLNTNSMDKLFDLMMMTFKYQLLLCKSGQELLLLTMNHLDGLRELVNSKEHMKIINKTCTKLTDTFSVFSEGQLMIVRHTLLALLQDCNRKVSLFLSRNLQLSNGEFVLPHGGKVPYGAQPPGMVRYLYRDHKVEMVTLWCNYDGMERKGSLDVTGDRAVTIGENLYSHNKEEEEPDGTPVVPTNDKTSNKVQQLKRTDQGKTTSSDQAAKAELDFLQQLLIGFQHPPSESEFTLNLFDDSGSTAKPTRSTSAVPSSINITKSKQGGHVSKVMKDFDTTSLGTNQGDEDDLLSLMDAL